jgi:hypothetical protein
MPRQSSQPQLSRIDPDRLGVEVADQVRGHVTRLALALGMTLRENGPCDLASTVSDLARYAQAGGDVDEADEAIADVCRALYSSAASPGFSVDLSALAELDEPVGVVIAAALARSALDRGQPVSTRGLAALASLSVRQVQMLAAQGEIAVEDGRVAVSEARRWLSGRGVAGFSGKKR